MPDDGGYQPPKPGDPDYPNPPKPDIDDTLPRSIALNVPAITLVQGDTFDLSERVNIYPATASQRDLTYRSDDENIATINSQGLIEGNNIGTTSVRVMTVNNLSKNVQVRVLPNYDQIGLEVTDIEVSDRSAGIFTISFTAMENGKGYSGPGEITTISHLGEKNEKVRTNRVYFNRGQASIKYNGGQFGVWRTDFVTSLKIRDYESKISYEFSKKSKSPATIIETWAESSKK